MTGGGLDILLINPPPSILTYSDYRFQNVPLSLVYLAGHARKLGFTARIIDAYNEMIPAEEVVSMAAALKPAVLGITCDTSRLERTQTIFRSLRDALPDALFTAGGALPSFRQDVFFPWVDAVVKGEGEAAFAELVSNRLEGKNLGGILGVYLKDGEDYSYTGDRSPIRDLDSCFHPAWDLVDMRHNFYSWGRRSPVATLVLSRGCPGRCAYCTIHPLWGHQHRQVSVERSIAEIDKLQREYGVREIYFKDNLFTLNKDWVHRFCAELQARDVKLAWSCGTGVRYVDRPLLKAMRKAGCHTINYGFESGEQATLDRMRKGVAVEQNLEAARLTREAGIRVFGFFMIGYPGETEEDIRKTVGLAKRIEPDIVMFSRVTPFPGSELWYQAGLDKMPADEFRVQDFNWYARSSGESPGVPFRRRQREAMAAVRGRRYWMRQLTGTPPSALLRLLARFFWLLKVRLQPRYRHVRKFTDQPTL